ncbi:MAG: TIR domain-containing protein [Planctomycetota bacterium]|nr:TIR domain-containing protein [Planctomycetota bacterium]
MAKPTEQPKPTTSTHYDAVFCYPRKYLDWIQGVRQGLCRRGLSIWTDTVDVRPGDKWVLDFQDAARNSSSAVVFFGPDGIGQWQEEEIPFLQRLHVGNHLRLIPVVLPDGQIPDGHDMALASMAAVQIERLADELTLLDQLEFAITGKAPNDPRGLYEIHAEVRLDPSCFLAISRTTPEELASVMSAAILDMDLTITQPLQFSDDPSNVFTPDVLQAIRAAQVVIADGTTCSETGKPDADVMYEVGLATAYGKPVIFVTNPQSTPLPLPIFACERASWRIEYLKDETGLNVGGPLTEDITNQIREILANGRSPHLVHRNDLGIGLAFADVFRLRVSFWDRFEEVFRYGLHLKTVFAELQTNLHKLQQIADLLHDDITRRRANINVNNSLETFKTVYDHFFKSHFGHFESPSFTNDEVVGDLQARNVILNHRDTTAKAFEYLLANIDNETVRGIVDKSSHFFQIIDSYLEGYLTSHDGLLDRMKDEEQQSTPRPLRYVIHLHAAIRELVRNAELVPVHACEMMCALLDLLSTHNKEGGD